MAVVQGSRVRHRAAARGWDVPALAEETGIPKGTLRNCLRDRNPQPIHLTRVYSLAHALCRRGEDVEELVHYFIADETNDGVPDEPPAQPPGPTKPKDERRKEKAGKGPRRIDDSARGVA
jgi:transcriptional regulator with XRE-family HTH domain